MEKVILINSPIYDRKVADKEDYLPPFGLGYIATNLKNNKIDVEIIDAVYNNYTVEDLNKIIEEKRPSVVGINVFSINFELVKKLIEGCKIETKFIIGGKTTRFLHQDLIKIKTTNEINVTIGESELITIDIVREELKEKPIFKEQKRNVYLVNDKSIYLPKNLDEIKLDRSFFDQREITNPYGELEEAMVTSRECLYNCAFCGGARSLNKDISVRSRTTKSIVEELNYIKTTNPKTTSIRILDDLFLKNRKSIIEAISIFSQFDFNFRAMAHIMSLINSKDLFPMLKSSGCKEIEIGIESGSDLIRKSINKVGSVEEVKSVVKSILDAGINVKGYIMYGIPNENEDDCIKSYALSKELYEYSKKTSGNFKASSFQFRPYHGTELYNKITSDIIYSHDDSLNNLSGRQQFNFTAGNFSDCPQEIINKLVVLTNNLDREEEYEINKKL